MFVLNEEAGEILMGVESVCGDDFSLQLQWCQQWFCFRDFIRLGRDFSLGNRDAFLVDKSRKQVHPGPIRAVCSAEGFPVHADRIPRGQTGHPGGNGSIHCVCVDALQLPAQGGFAGRDIPLFFFPAPQTLQHLLRTLCCPLGDRRITAASAHDGAHGQGNEGEVSVANPSLVTGIRKCFQDVDQIIYLSVSVKRAWSASFS